MISLESQSARRQQKSSKDTVEKVLTKKTIRLGFETNLQIRCVKVLTLSHVQAIVRHHLESSMFLLKELFSELVKTL